MGAKQSQHIYEVCEAAEVDDDVEFMRTVHQRIVNNQALTLKSVQRAIHDKSHVEIRLKMDSYLPLYTTRSLNWICEKLNRDYLRTQVKQQLGKKYDVYIELQMECSDAYGWCEIIDTVPSRPVTNMKLKFTVWSTSI